MRGAGPLDTPPKPRIGTTRKMRTHDPEGDALKVNEAGLVCGGVKTANATVYMIDTVLMPPAN